MTDLLMALDTLVRQDQAVPGFTGTLSIGVRYPRQVVWWVATFGDAVRAEFRSRMPERADAILGLGEREARQVMGTPLEEDLPSLCLGSGDQDLMDRFFERYVRHQNMMSLRFGMAGLQ